MFSEMKMMMKSTQGLNKMQNEITQQRSQNDRNVERIAISIKNPEKKVLYYHPLNQYTQLTIIKENQKIFHPKDWTVQNFIIGRYLGNGKYGKVYLAKQKKTKLILALKCITKQKILQEEVLSQIRRQIEIHSHLKHKNILNMYGFFFDQKSIYIMMQYATQGDLYGLLRKKGKFDELTVKKYMRQMLNAFVYLQSKNIIHRDIKPQNIMVSNDGILKLSDFGWSIKSSSTQRKTFCGTPEYFCPEIIMYRPFDKKVDNWSLGILAYELLCGKPPFYVSSKKKMYEMILRHQIIFPNFASQAFRDFVIKLTKKDSNQRMELIEALKHPWLREEMQEQDFEI